MLIFWDLPNHFRNIIDSLKQEQLRFLIKNYAQKMSFTFLEDYEKKYLTSTGNLSPHETYCQKLPSFVP